MILIKYILNFKTKIVAIISKFSYDMFTFYHIEQFRSIENIKTYHIFKLFVFTSYRLRKRDAIIDQFANMLIIKECKQKTVVII